VASHLAVGSSQAAPPHPGGGGEQPDRVLSGHLPAFSLAVTSWSQAKRPAIAVWRDQKNQAQQPGRCGASRRRDRQPSHEAAHGLPGLKPLIQQASPNAMIFGDRSPAPPGRASLIPALRGGTGRDRPSLPAGWVVASHSAYHLTDVTHLHRCNHRIPIPGCDS